MRFIYRDTATAEELDPKTVSVMELLREHTVRYVLNTSAGAIILRPLPWRMKRIIDEARANIYPRTADLIAEAEHIRPYIDGIPEDNRPADKVRRMNEIYQELRATDMYALGVIVSPPVGTMEDVDEIFSRITLEEVDSLAICIQMLSSVTSPDSVDPIALEIATANGLRLVDREMLELMTVSQASFFARRIEQENERIKQITRQYEREVR